MKKNMFLSSILMMSISTVSAADFLTGNIIDNQDGSFQLKSPEGIFILEASETIKKSLSSLANPTYVTQSDGNPYPYEFKGNLSEGNVFTLEQTPTNIAGAESMTGVLTKVGDRFYIGDQEVAFGYSKVLNRYEFDDISKQSFIGKELIVEGRMEAGVFIMQALTPVGLFSAARAKPSIYSKQFKANPYKFLEDTVYKNIVSKSQNSFRETVYNEKGYNVKSGESVFLVTLSGRQGDSFGSVNGHFVAGLGEVKDDLTLRAEVSNAYVTNGKDILSGNTSLTNYFSNMVQGQNNYRPTYTFLVYGIDKDKLQTFRDYMEPSHIRFRTEKLSITAQFNCTTETANGLVLAGIEGNHKTGLNRIFDRNNLAWWAKAIKMDGPAGQFVYSLYTDKEDFQPRPAFHSYIDTLKKKKMIKELGIKRIDYVFYAQIPSARPVGGAPLKHLFTPGKPNAVKYLKLYKEYEDVPTEEQLPHDQLLKELKLLDKIE